MMVTFRSPQPPSHSLSIPYPFPPSDEGNPFKPEYLLLIVAGMFTAYLMRKWHYRKPKALHQG